MVTLVWNPLRRWWLAGPCAPKTVAAVEFRQPALRTARKPSPVALSTPRPLTPFRQDAVSPTGSTVHGARREARRFWMNLDPQDRRRAAIGGSFAQVCAALESLAAVESSMKP
jgi:hypothetical protein